ELEQEDTAVLEEGPDREQDADQAAEEAPTGLTLQRRPGLGVLGRGRRVAGRGRRLARRRIDRRGRGARRRHVARRRGRRVLRGLRRPVVAGRRWRRIVGWRRWLILPGLPGLARTLRVRLSLFLLAHVT